MKAIINHVKLKEKWIKVIGDNLPPDQFRLYKALTEYSYVNRNSILKKYEINLEKLKKDSIYIASLFQLIPGKQYHEKFQKLRDDKLIVINNKPKNEPDVRKGIPQGSGMSSVLSNIYLIDFDKDLSIRAKNGEFFYRRYCDDIVIICDSDKAENLKNEIIEKIDKECLLEIQDKKVELTEFRPNSVGKIRAFNKKKQYKLGIAHTNEKNEKLFYKSLQYLGFEFNGQDIHIRASSLSRYFRKMKGRIIKTVLMAYSDNSKSNSIWKKQIFEKYSHLGNRNFLTYAYNASKEFYKNSNGVQKEGMNSSAIKRQLSRHFTILQNTLNSKNNQRFKNKKYLGKVKLKKNIK
jgi:RNA-directed DNA polymerase